MAQLGADRTRGIVIPPEPAGAIGCTLPSSDVGDQVHARHKADAVGQKVRQMELARPVSRWLLSCDLVEPPRPVLCTDVTQLIERG